MERATLKSRLKQLRDHLLVNLIERDTPVRLVFLAALAGEHVLLVGPPGTAKSEIARRLRHVFREAGFVERLVTRHTTPEELLGPFSVKGLEEDRYVRLVRGYLPSATFAFVDQIFQANSAVLNSLLTLIHEREFEVGLQRVRIPLLSIIGAGTDLPEDDDLRALNDRFLLRCYVPRLSEEGFDRLLGMPDAPVTPPEEALRLSREEVRRLQEAAVKVVVPDEIRSLLKGLRRFLADKDIEVSDRRWRKILYLLQVSAYTDGRDTVSVWDGWLLQHCVWQSPEQRDLVFDWYQKHLGANTSVDPVRFARLVAAWEKTYEEEKNSTWQARDRSGRLYYRDFLGKPTTESKGIRHKHNENGDPLYLLPADQRNRSNDGKGYTASDLMKFFGYHHYYARSDEFNAYLANEENWLMEEVPFEPIVEPTRYSRKHMQRRQRETEQLLKQADAMLATVDREIAELEALIEGHLWISPGFTAIAQRNLLETRETVEDLKRRVQAIYDGFGSLPKLPD